MTRQGFRRIAALVTVGALTVAACGAGDDVEEPVDDAEAPGVATDDGDDDGNADVGGDGVDAAAGDCLSEEEASGVLEEATYAVILQILLGYEDDEPVYRNEFIGTAWAQSDRRLVTNAHVAEIPFELPGVKVVAVQAGTGEVVNLLSAYIHPDWESVDSPDVGVFTTQERLPSALLLAPETLVLTVRQDLLLTGFPGDVESIYSVEPGEVVPQASASTGKVTALRNFADDVEVSPDQVDVIQHDAITTGGNSGSALWSCDAVVGTHNAGISFNVFTQQATGEVTLERVAGTNRFGIHVRYIHELIDLIESGALEGASVQGAGILDQCPPPTEYLDAVAAGTYAVVAEVLVGQDQQGQPVTAFAPIGTAFAVGDRVLATNAHVTEGTKSVGAPVVEMYGVQSGTGAVVKLLRGITHPSYTGDPLGSPDVGLFTTEQQLPTILSIADPAAVVLRRGEEISVTGFPGDVNDFIQIVPGQTVPQATSLTGAVTALRSHDGASEVGPENTDVIQHQAPTTPGTSGSALIHCGLVVGTNNAGTIQLIVTVDDSGQPTIDRTAAAANNFAVHVRYIVELLELFEDQAIQGFELPPPPASTTGGGDAGATASPSSEDWFVGTWQGASDATAAQHALTFTVAVDGSVIGTSTWPETGEFALTGQVDANGYLLLRDDANERLGFRTGIYEGYLQPDGTAQGAYYEDTEEATRYLWSAQRTG